nr:hypothetical protein CFP56_19384 [Quercus suber]
MHALEGSVVSSTAVSNFPSMVKRLSDLRKPSCHLDTKCRCLRLIKSAGSFSSARSLHTRCKERMCGYEGPLNT